MNLQANENGRNTRRERIARRAGRRRQSKILKLFALLFVALCIAGVYMLLSSRSGISPVESIAGNQPTSAPLQTDESVNNYIGNAGLTLRERYSKIVWLDAGHGGIDGGTSAMHNGVMYLEKDIALNIVLMVYEMFEQSDSGIKAFLTRSSDIFVPLHDRPKMWNDSADLVVSVHVDYYEGPTAHQVSGVQVNYYDTVNTGRVNLTNAQFAQIIQDHLVQETGARDRRIRGDRAFIVCSHSTMPALLVETGFMSNPEELALLVTQEYQRQIAFAIYNAIVEAFEFLE